MENPQRAALAFLCGCIHNGLRTRHNGIHDYADGSFAQFSFNNNGGSVTVFDFQRSCYLTGRFPSFYDYGVSAYITLTKLNDNMFNVFDYHTSSYLSVTCNGTTVTVFDYANGNYFNYQLN